MAQCLFIRILLAPTANLYTSGILQECRNRLKAFWDLAVEEGSLSRERCWQANGIYPPPGTPIAKQRHEEGRLVADDRVAELGSLFRGYGTDNCGRVGPCL